MIPPNSYHTSLVRNYHSQGLKSAHDEGHLQHESPEQYIAPRKLYHLLRTFLILTFLFEQADFLLRKGHCMELLEEVEQFVGVGYVFEFVAVCVCQVFRI